MSKLVSLVDSAGQVIKSSVVTDVEVEETKKVYENDKKNLTNGGEGCTIKVLDKITG
jgi:hypothetical protein